MINDFKDYVLNGVKASDSYKLIWAKEVIEMYVEHLNEKVEQENLDSEDIDEINEELACAKIVNDYLSKLAHEMKIKNELATLINEISK